MLNYIRAEFYKVFHRKYTYIFTAIMLACEALLVGGWLISNANGNRIDFYNGAGMIVPMLSLGLYLGVVLCDLVFSEQYKSNTLKNEVSFGIPRARIYLGKLVVELVMGLLLAAVFVSFYVGLCYFALPHNPEKDAVALQIVSYCLAGALPLWLGAAALANACFFLIRGSIASACLAVGLFVAPAPLFEVMAKLINDIFWVPYHLTLTVPLESLSSTVGIWGPVANCWLIGLGWVVVPTIAGLIGFRKKEIS